MNKQLRPTYKVDMTIEIADYRKDEEAYSWETLKKLEPIANRDINKLWSDEPNLLVFPHVLGKYYNDGLEEEGKTICSIYKSKKEGKEEKGVLETGDIMGFVGCNGTELTIHSRFAENDVNDFFLHYMVQKVFNVNIFDLQHSSARDRVFDFLICLFPNCLKEALKQGMYKQYVVNRYNDSNVRGMIDVARHIKRDIPFAGNVAYNVREYSYDNSITQLIRHTIEYIRTTPMSRILKRDSYTDSYVSQICEATPSYKKQDRGKIISKNLKSPTHPYYLKYIDLQKLCVKILTHKKLKYGEDSNRIYGLLFSGSWLWEEFLYKAVLKDYGFEHPKNRERTGAIYLFENKKSYKRYPDYYKEDIVLDAKYKHVEKEVARNDMHQIISYMHIQKATKGGFVYPYNNMDDEGTTKEYIGRLRGYGGDVYKVGLLIPSTSNISNYDEFVALMEEKQQKLRMSIGKIIAKSCAL